MYSLSLLSSAGGASSGIRSDDDARERRSHTTPDKPKNKWRDPKLGYAFIHTVIDDHSRVAYSEAHDDETATTAVAVMHRAVECDLPPRLGPDVVRVVGFHLMGALPSVVGRCEIAQR
ncbi:hypothetical protein CGZ91_00005 [Parenemella sanctibonifatiensis]|uniref:Uncharacterized protein n=1 Tax=Parenemella sanctibonifatiensis TaxID=2016505 RepID=A0A255EQS4_9ACTN|nr:hypothetical protein CGZ91_00005 [Parenemella sanctibonifatiensis]